MSPFRKKILVSLLVAGLALPVLLLVWYNAGRVEGTEFSPDNFSLRDFSYNRDPLFGQILAEREVAPSRSAIFVDLVADGWIQPISKQPPTWHLVSENSSASLRQVSKDCDARFLTGYLELTTADHENVWTVWNMDYPAAAKVFWPLVADLARDEMYLKIPEIMQYALDQKPADAQEFETRLLAMAAASYLELARIDLELGRSQRALYRAQQSQQRVPSPEAAELLAAASAKLAAEASEVP